MKIPIDNIIVENRVRRNPGDLNSLKASLAKLGQLVPIGVTVREEDGRYRYQLVHGFRRLTAAKELGWSEIDARVLADLNDLERLLAERDENVERKQLTLSEAAEFTARILPLERIAAKERQREGARRAHQASGKFPEPQKGQALDRVASMVGLSRKTLLKAQTVTLAAKANPKKFGHIREEMDRTGNVSRAHKRLQTIQRAGGGPGSEVDEDEMTAAELEDKLFRVTAKAVEKLSEATAGGRRPAVSDRMRTALKVLIKLANRLLEDSERKR